MRSTVLILDSLVYVPALVMFVQTWQRTRSKRTQVRAKARLGSPAKVVVATHPSKEHGAVDTVVSTSSFAHRLRAFSI
jgi:alpha-1,3-glucosyltransferase